MSAGTYEIWGGDDPMVPRRYAEIIAFTQDLNPDVPEEASIEDMSPLFGLLRLHYLLRVDGTQVHVRQTSLRELPRATLVSGWSVIADRDQRFAAMSHREFDPRQTAFLDSEPSPP